MTTKLSPGRIGMPPPPSVTTDERLIAVNEGDGKYRLESTRGAAAGWIRGHTVGLKGFESVADALRAAPMLHQTLDAVLRQHHREWRRHNVRYDALQLVHDGAYEWIAAGNRPLASVPTDSGCIAQRHGEHRDGSAVVQQEATILSAALAIEECLRMYVGERHAD